MASIWEGLGPPKWSQVGHFGLRTFRLVVIFTVLKIDVLKKSRLGGPRARFWRPQGSILEPLGLEFGRFRKVLGSIFRQKVGKKVFLTSRFGLVGSVLNSWQSSYWPADNMRTNCSQNVGFHFPMCLQRCSPADACLKCMAIPLRSCTQMGRRRWPPLGGVQWNWFL